MSRNRWLQWGRNIIVTEIPPSAAILAAFPKLQWGRNIIVTEMIQDTNASLQTSPRFNGAVTLSLRKFPILDKYKPKKSELQWGRNIIVTEIRYQLLSLWLDFFFSFNGAVTLSLRKFEIKGSDEKWFTLLQWGRNIIVTEIG